MRNPPRPTNIRVNPFTIRRRSSAHNGAETAATDYRADPLFTTPVHRTLIALLLPITDGTEAAVASSALWDPMIEIATLKTLPVFTQLFIHVLRQTRRKAMSINAEKLFDFNAR